ncbi:MAG: Mth938-like domain-containing protein [Alphaproteobacteria bacterium]
MTDQSPFLPERVPIDAYGGGGFRFGEMSHRGSLLILPGGVYGWPLVSFDEMTPDVFDRVFGQAKEIDFLLLGTGERRLNPPGDVSQAFHEAGIGLEIMDTGAACRTFNVLLQESRAVAAALLAVE